MSSGIDYRELRIDTPSRLFLAIILVLVMSGCASTLQYNPAYIGNPAPASTEALEGKAAVLITPEDSVVQFSGGPTSFTGGATSATIPFGTIIAQAAKVVYGKLFADGVDEVNVMPEGRKYRYVVQPQLGGFSYAYNSAKSLGLAVTPQADLSILVSVYDSSGNLLSRKTYSSGLRDGDTYAVSGNPAEKINRLAHTLTVELLDKSAIELHGAQKE